jgi:hypothetical protein
MGRRKRSSIDVSFYAFIFLGTVYFSFLFFESVEGFYGRVCDEGFTGVKVTVPKRLRNLFDVKDGDYVRLALV